MAALLLPTTLQALAFSTPLPAASHVTTRSTDVSMHLPVPVSSLCLTSLCSVAATPDLTAMATMSPGDAAMMNSLAATSAGLLATALLSPLVTSAVDEVHQLHQAFLKEDDYCELIGNFAPPTMHQPVLTSDEGADLWWCPDGSLEDPRHELQVPCFGASN